MRGKIGWNHGWKVINCFMIPFIRTLFVFFLLDCEPGLVLKEIKTDPTQNGMTKEVLRKVELKEMRAKYGLGVGLKVSS